MPPELYEVTVNVGRDGEFILNEGRHRFSVANALGLSSIPVRVLIRHKEWQQMREEIVSKENHSHPDLAYLT